ncbi:ATP-binding protein [Sporobolomyces koalae]|uniref:ATP-binding protein n=1 Tax=Sporobolomyces koalae TaxID=500713 RepID=UPI00317191E9
MLRRAGVLLPWPRPVLQACARARVVPAARGHVQRSIANNAVAPQIGYSNDYDMSKDISEEQRESSDGPQGRGSGGSGGGRGPSGFRTSIESMLATFAGVALIAGTGAAYHYWYKWEVLRKMERAFTAGFDPALELALAAKFEADGSIKKGRIRRKEQDYIDKVMNGEVTGEYLLLLGPKGTGKTSMVLEAMINNSADGIAMLEAHEDAEVVRLRLGKALDFEYSEDSFAGLFQRRDPREAGPILDIERALSKLEKVAIRFRKKHGRPIVIVMQNIHFVRDDDDGHALLHMLQQRAEAWAGSGVATFVFISDNFHTYRHLRRSATRMQTLSIRDLTPRETHDYLAGTHERLFPDAPRVTRDQSLKIWDMIGGRLSFLAKVVKSHDMEAKAKDLVSEHKEWLHSRVGLIPDLDDDVMDEQKVSYCSFLLFQHFAKLAQNPKAAISSAVLKKIEKEEHEHEPEEAIELDLINSLPEDLDIKVTYRDARFIMTRPDYIDDLDQWHIINVDKHHYVRPDSRLMLTVFKEVAAEEDFQDQIDNVMDRVNFIESLHRTRELTVKTGDGDLGGFLRLRLGHLLPEHEKKDEGDDEAGAEADTDNEKGEEKAPSQTDARPEEKEV